MRLYASLSAKLLFKRAGGRDKRTGALAQSGGQAPSRAFPLSDLNRPYYLQVGSLNWRLRSRINFGWPPWLAGSEHGLERNDKLTHYGGDDQFAWLAVLLGVFWRRAA